MMKEVLKCPHKASIGIQHHTLLEAFLMAKMISGEKGGDDEDYFDCQPKRGLWQDDVRD